MTLDEIQAAVRVWALERPEATPTLIQSIVNKVYISMATPFRFHEVEQEYLLTTVAGTRDYALASEDLYALREAFNRYYGNSLDVVDISQLDRSLDYETIEGRPGKIARYGTGVRFDIAPDFSETDSIILRGVVLPPKLVTGTDEPVYPEDWHWIIELQSASVVCFMLGMEERGQLLQNIAMGQLAGRQEAHTIEAFTKQMQLIAGYRDRSSSKPTIR